MKPLKTAIPLKNHGKKPFFSPWLLLPLAAIAAVILVRVITPEIPAHLIQKTAQEDGLGDGNELLIEKREGQPAKIRFLLRDAAKKPVSGAKVFLRLTRDDGKEDAITMPLIMREAGVYRSEIPVKPGAWTAWVTVEAGKQTYQVTRQVDLP